MLFKRYTKAVLIGISLSFWLSACTSTLPDKSTVEANKPADKEALGRSVEAAPNSATDDTGKGEIVNPKNYSKRIPAPNLYLQQQAGQANTIPRDVLKNYQQALGFMEAEQWQKAQVLFDQVILSQPQLSGSYVNKAIIAQRQNELTQALNLLDKAISINKLNLYAHHLQGQIYRTQGQFDKAEQSYLAALAIWPDFPEAQLSMAILLELYRGRLLDAHNYYSAYLLLNRDDEEVKRWQAGLEIKMKRAGVAIPAVEAMEPQEAVGLTETAVPQKASAETAIIHSDHTIVNQQKTSITNPEEQKND